MQVSPFSMGGEYVMGASPNLSGIAIGNTPAGSRQQLGRLAMNRK